MLDFDLAKKLIRHNSKHDHDYTRLYYSKLQNYLIIVVLAEYFLECIIILSFRNDRPIPEDMIF